MENMTETTCKHFSMRTEVIGQSLDMLGIKRNKDGTLLFPRHSGKRFPVARIRKRLAAYGWQGERLNKKVARIAASPDILPDGGEYSIISPYGWREEQLTRKMWRTFLRETGRRILIMLDGSRQLIDSRERQ